MTNNSSEAYNYRMKKIHGDHPNLPKFIGALKKENTTIELQWMQRDRPKSTQIRRREDRERFEKRRLWEEDLRSAMDGEISNEELMIFADRMAAINRRKKTKKIFAPTYPSRGRGRGRGRGRPRGPIRAQTRPDPVSPRSPRSHTQNLNESSSSSSSSS